MAATLRPVAGRHSGSSRPPCEAGGPRRPPSAPSRGDLLGPVRPTRPAHSSRALWAQRLPRDRPLGRLTAWADPGPAFRQPTTWALSGQPSRSTLRPPRPLALGPPGSRRHGQARGRRASPPSGIRPPSREASPGGDPRLHGASTPRNFRHPRVRPLPLGVPRPFWVGNNPHPVAPRPLLGGKPRSCRSRLSAHDVKVVVPTRHPRVRATPRGAASVWPSCLVSPSGTGAYLPRPSRTSRYGLRVSSPYAYRHQPGPPPRPAVRARRLPC